jgi:hypothetical protein
VGNVGASAYVRSAWYGVAARAWWSEWRCSLKTNQLVTLCGAFHECAGVTGSYAFSCFFFFVETRSSDVMSSSEGHARQSVVLDVVHELEQRDRDERL